MVYINYGKLTLAGENTCKDCGYASPESEAFVIQVDGMLCHDCYDNVLYQIDIENFNAEEARKAEALAYAINVDYLD